MIEPIIWKLARKVKKLALIGVIVASNCIPQATGTARNPT
jgi:hypothetical protein